MPVVAPGLGEVGLQERLQLPLLAATLDMGKSAKLDDAIAEFSIRYAQQNLLDYAAFNEAIAEGVLPIATEGF